MTDVRPIKSVNWNMKTNHQYIPKPKIAGGNIKKPHLTTWLLN